MEGIALRPWRLPEDGPAIERCLNELDEYEKSIEPLMKEVHTDPKELVADLEKTCRQKHGEVFVSVDETSGAIVGCMCVHRGESVDEEVGHPSEAATISLVVVLPDYRRRGIGSHFMLEAERYAQRQYLEFIKVNVLKSNTSAADLYHRSGFRDYLIQMIKPVQQHHLSDK
eukprot:TRINITY_DN10266_c0_g1_i1.p1 TRINITY_DN10266_c0_g1~~TRINITY_DN10266_c0_g1_i1.p1  ORF type:complete len:171 (+),score=26.55 TRINITY_DN10266_c0_g1_i1:90-602(+)